jgi:4-hydroxy-tetrahydrodipicolinate synthase
MTTLLQSRLITALITPFSDDETIDWEALTRVTQHVIHTGTEALVLCGTTGEGSALTTDEKIALVKHIKSITTTHAESIPLIAATGTNNTRATIALSQSLIQAGAEALLVVCPYYVKPSQEGLFQHFNAVAKAVFPAPIIIYNIPGRCSIGMTAHTMARLALEAPNIVGVKQSYGDMDAVSEIRHLCPEAFKIWSGDDSLTLPMMALGAQGVISVAAHVFGRDMLALLQAAATGNYANAQRIHNDLFPAIRALFTHPNPMDVKACLAEIGLIGPTLRLPLVSLSALEKAEISTLFQLLKPATPSHSSQPLSARTT